VDSCNTCINCWDIPLEGATGEPELGTRMHGFDQFDEAAMHSHDGCKAPIGAIACCRGPVLAGNKVPS
jgi:hypothetical protein